MKKHCFKQVMGLLLLLALLPALFSGAAFRARAAGTVTVSPQNYTSWYSRMVQKFPGVFTLGTIQDTGGNELGVVDDLRVVLYPDSYYGQPLISYIDGRPKESVPGTLSFDGFFSGEKFSVDGKVAYCFDYATPAGDGSAHQASASFAEAGITLNEEITMNVARAANALTANNFKLFKDKADEIAREFTNSHTNHTITKEAVKALLLSDDADAILFKRMMVQLMVWTYMNQMVFGTEYPSFTPSQGYYDKEGKWHEPQDVVMPPTTSVTSVIPMDTLYTVGLTNYYDGDFTITTAHEAEYELTVGQAFTVPAGEVYIVKKVAADNGGKVESSGTVQVDINGDRVTLTATREIPEWSEWLRGTDVSQSIFSSKPYAEGVTGQFIVNAESVETYQLRVKAEKAKISFDPIGILLTKKDAQSQDEVRPVAQ